MNATNYTYAFLAATALKQPFPAVSDTGATAADVRQMVTGDITMTGADRDRMVKGALITGGVLTVVAGAIVYTVVAMISKKRRK